MLLAYVLPDTRPEHLMRWKSNQLLALQSQVRSIDQTESRNS